MGDRQRELGLGGFSVFYKMAWGSAERLDRASSASPMVESRLGWLLGFCFSVRPLNQQSGRTGGRGDEREWIFHWI